MAALLALLYGLAAYAVFLATFLYAIAFVAGLPVPRTVDAGGPDAALPVALAVNVLLLGLFAVQHSVMARPVFKRWWTRIVPRPVERSTFVLAASLALIALFVHWHPIPGVVWKVHDPAAALLLHVVAGLGWTMVLVSTFLIDHFELFGLKQVVAVLTGRPLSAPVFRTPLLYRHVRHPIYLGFLLAFWATPAMSAGHLLFALATSGYILLGIWFEERDLIAQFGDRYRAYRAQVGMLLPRWGRRTGGQGAPHETTR